MSFQYDQYLARHRANVKRGFDWLSENLPGLMTNTLTAGWNTEFAHDQSKNDTEYTGTIFTELQDKTISDNSSFYENSTIDETVDYLESDWELWLFWVIWIIVIGLCVFGFYYIDNEWLEN